MTEQFERFEVGKLYDYYIGDKGTAFKRSHKMKRESPIKIYLHRGHAEIKVNNKEYRVKNLVAARFIRTYKRGDYVECIDENPKNVSVENLRIYTQAEHGKRTGHLSNRAKEITINGETYKSIRQAAKANYISYQTLLDYMSGTVKNSVIKGMVAQMGK